MAVDPRKPRTVLVIHGVQTGDDSYLNQDWLIEQLLKSRLGNLSSGQYAASIQDRSFSLWKFKQSSAKQISEINQTHSANPIDEVLAGNALDLIGDVVTARLDTSTAAQIRQGFKDKILDTFTEGSPCYVVAHSLGSIYAFDVINELIKDKHYFDRNSRRSWPVQGFITLGSPIKFVDVQEKASESPIFWRGDQDVPLAQLFST